jgi:hypothetical protein
MSRHLENWVRTLNELRDRYGPHDPIVSQWQSDLETREAFEFRFPARLMPVNTNPLGRKMRERFSNRSRKLVVTERRGGAVGRLLTHH